MPFAEKGELSTGRDAGVGTGRKRGARTKSLDEMNTKPQAPKACTEDDASPAEGDPHLNAYVPEFRYPWDSLGTAGCPSFISPAHPGPSPPNSRGSAEPGTLFPAVLLAAGKAGAPTERGSRLL